MLSIDRGGKEYRVEKLSAMEQFHVTRKAAPVLPSILPLMTAMARGEHAKVLEGGDAGAMMKAMQPLADALAQMPDDQAEYIFDACLSKVKRNEGNGIWAPIWVRKQLMFADLQLFDQYFFIFQVFKDSLGNFMQGLAIEATPVQSPVSS